MRIVHYSLGFPPYRTGGMTKFCMDLMKQQRREGHDVALLWPGMMTWRRKKTEIKYRGYTEGIKSYEIINPAPVPLDEGIRDIGPFTEAGNGEAYEILLNKIRPDILHVHTLMGLHKELLEQAKTKNIRMVFSVHDFFPICPKVILFREGAVCDCISSCMECSRCNATALPIWKIRLMQSHLYRVLKDSFILKRLRKVHRDSFLNQRTVKGRGKQAVKSCSNDYAMLRQYYESMLRYMDVMHFNSSLTEQIYNRYMKIGRSVRIPVTHGDVKNHKKRKMFGEHIRMTYLGPQGSAKGYFLLKEVLDKRWKEKQDFSLRVFFRPTQNAAYIKSEERYSYNQLESIFDKTDILIAPSLWYETFGYTVLEALSFGVPVLVTQNVGAKDIIPEGCGIIVEEMTEEGLSEAIEWLNSRSLGEMNQRIVDKFDILTIEKMSRLVMENCYEGNYE